MSLRISIASVLVFAVALSPAAAAVIQVPADQPKIQAAINVANDRDEILVAPGIYHETIDLLGKPVTVRSSDGAEVTILGYPGNVFRTPHGWNYFDYVGTIVACWSGETRKTVIDGFTITGGAGNPIGGGMLNVYSKPTVVNCVFTGNMAGQLGGGICNINSSPAVTNCRFTQNTAYLGGAIYNNRSDTVVTNCIFNGNCATNQGGAVSNAESNPTLTNCTFSCNWAYSQGGALDNLCSDPTLTNCILWGDSPNEVINCDVSAPLFSYNVVALGLPPGAVDGGYNAFSDPLFVDIEGADGQAGTLDDDLRLEPHSACVNAGDNRSVPHGLWTDLDGNPRIVNHHVDLGAYERYVPGDCVSKSSCPEADIDCDSFVSGLDIAVILSSGNWSMPVEAAMNPAADINRDGIINGFDLLVARSTECFGE